jgi:hypothetical protein
MSETKDLAVQEEQTAVVPQGQQMYAAVLQAVHDPETDPDRLEKFLAVAERMEAAQARRSFVRAFHAAQQAMDGIVITKQGKIQYKQGAVIKYAKYDDIARLIKPILREHGLTESYSYEYTESPPKVTCVMTLKHIDGHAETFRSVPLPMVDSSGGKTDVQGAGSIASYGKRFVIVPAFNLVTEDEDDDGSGQGVQPVIDQEQADEIERCLAIVEEHESGGTKRFFAWLGKSHGTTDLRELRQGAQLDIVMGKLRAKLAKIGGGK